MSATRMPDIRPRGLMVADGFDTLDIAKQWGVSEAEVYNRLPGVTDLAFRPMAYAPIRRIEAVR